MGSLHSLLAPPLVSCRFSSFVNKSWCRDLLTVCFANLSARLYLRVARGWSPNLTHEIAGSSFLSENAATALCSVLWSLRDCWAVSPLPQTTDAASRWTLPSAFQKLHIVFSSSPSFFILLKTQIFLDALLTMVSTCSPQRRSFCTITPSIFRDDLTSRCSEFPTENSGGKSWILLGLHIIIRLFFSLMTRLLSFTSFANLSSSS